MTSILLCSYNRVTDILLKQDLVKMPVTIKLIVNCKKSHSGNGFCNYFVAVLMYKIWWAG